MQKAESEIMKTDQPPIWRHSRASWYRSLLAVVALSGVLSAVAYGDTITAYTFEVSGLVWVTGDQSYNPGYPAPNGALYVDSLNPSVAGPGSYFDFAFPTRSVVDLTGAPISSLENIPVVSWYQPWPSEWLWANDPTWTLMPGTTEFWVKVTGWEDGQDLVGYVGVGNWVGPPYSPAAPPDDGGQETPPPVPDRGNPAAMLALSIAGLGLAARRFKRAS